MRCLEHIERKGTWALEALCSAHPAQAQWLRSRVRKRAESLLLIGQELPLALGERSVDG